MNLQQMLNMQRRNAPAPDAPLPDTSEKVQISSLSLLKMLKHGKLIFVRCLCVTPPRKSRSSHGSDGAYAWPIC